MIELGLVLVIAAVLVYISVRMLRPLDAQAFQSAERLRDDLRLVQMLAITWNQPMRVTRASVGGIDRYEVCCLTAAMAGCTTIAGTGCDTNPITHPGTGQSFRVDLASGLTLTPTAATFHFDTLGRPATGAARRNTVFTYTLSGGASPRTVTVAPITGFATLQ